MTTPDDALAQVDQLLQQRTQYEQWLAKLTGAGSKAPEAVRAKVRSDYEGRLNAVVDELRKHASVVETALAGHRQSLSELEARRADIEERLAEAEIRHSVGEYSEDEWSAVGAEAEAALQEIANRAGYEEGEIGRLAEVLQLIARPTAPAPTGPRLATPLPTPLAAEPPQVADATGAPRFVPKTPGPMRAAPAPRKESALDELDFLKSVTGEQSAVRRAAPVVRKGDSGPVKAIPMSSDPAEATDASETGSGIPSAGAATATKTLKCGECGTLNRPTEWYCERCGAELAAL